MVATIAAFILIIAQALSSHPAIAGVTTQKRVVAVAPPVKIASAMREELGPVVTAQSAVAVDVASGAMLFGKRPQAVRPLASITKLLTAMTLERSQPSWNEIVIIASEDIPSEGHTVFVPGDRVTLGELRSALLVGSDNGAANAIARSMGAQDFVSRMQEGAEKIGPTLRVVDPAGLRAENVGSAVDIAALARVVFTDFPEIRVASMRDALTVSAHRSGRERIIVRPTNDLLRDGRRHTFTIVGGKTGYLDEAGYNLVLEVERDDHLVTIVVLGSATSEDRFRDARLIADWVFENYKWSDANDAN